MIWLLVLTYLNKTEIISPNREKRYKIPFDVNSSLFYRTGQANCKFQLPMLLMKNPQ